MKRTSLGPMLLLAAVGCVLCVVLPKLAELASYAG